MKELTGWVSIWIVFYCAIWNLPLLNFFIAVGCANALALVECLTAYKKKGGDGDD